MAKRAQDIDKAQGPEAPLPLPFTLSEKKDASGEEKNAEGGEGQKGPEAFHARSRLPLEIKRFAVESFACFQDVTTIQQEIARRWGIALDARSVAKYDCRRPQCSVGQALRKLYAESRANYVNGVAEVAIAHQAHRLRLVTRLVDKATNSKDYAAALKGLELAAKEMGGALSGNVTVRHEGTIGHVHATVEEARAELAARLTQVVEGGLLVALPAPPTQEPQKSAIPEG